MTECLRHLRQRTIGGGVFERGGTAVAGIDIHAFGREGAIEHHEAMREIVGVSGATFDRAMAGVEPDMKVIEAMNNQPEFKTPIWDYLGTLVDDEKVAEGRNMLRQYASVFAAAEQRFGVDRHTIAAVWGVESDFGKARGKWPLVQSLATGACLAPRRNAFFKGELIATL